MSPTATAPGRSRQTAEARRDALVSAAVKHFARTGLHGTAVSAITDEVGITQPYAFSLFGTKKGLFLAAVEHCFDHLEQTFVAAADAAPEGERLAAMGESYSALLADRDWLLLQQQAYAACSDDDVRDVVRRRYARLYELVRDRSGADAPTLTQFFAAGMLMNVAAAMDLPSLVEGKEAWLSACDPGATAAPPGA
jgi:AcrR family transcriptional regulator